MNIVYGGGPAFFPGFPRPEAGLGGNFSFASPSAALVLVLTN